MEIIVRGYEAGDVEAMRAIWNEIVAEGTFFPQEVPLTYAQAEAFFGLRP